MHESLASYDPSYGGGFPGWGDVPWRRSAAQWLVELNLGPELGVCPSVTQRLRRWGEWQKGAVGGFKGGLGLIKTSGGRCL